MPKTGANGASLICGRTYETGSYRHYGALVAEAAIEVGLSPILAAQLAHGYAELKLWPEVREVPHALCGDGITLGIVTNSFEALGATAVAFRVL